ncbi:hypothetical protein M9H77_15039 [Catharanthus roseus]|uniref:Uncharacterized protein n=1 Tax=Catharanthus roseus TaxID=4058 RepID=A0ACC0BPT5_CATRO|nr:hypothetical protein M9H77_15039 [Catharanthus roseus]
MAALKWALSSAYNIIVQGNVAESASNKLKFPADAKTEQAKARGGGAKENCVSGFQMPLHYPRYKKSDYEKMEEWKLDVLLKEYGLNFNGNLEEKRRFAMGAFLWPDQM